MNVLERLGIGPRVFGFEIDHLPADHSVYGSGAASDLLNDLHPPLGRAAKPGQRFIGLRLQPISGEDRNRFAKDFVARRAPSPQIVVVESGKIVVDQRIGVQHFERCAQLFDSWRKSAGNRSPRLHA